MKVKVCGNTDLHQLQQLDQLNIDYAGLIFYEQSPRFVSNKLCGKEIKELQLSLRKVGVFVNANEDEIMKRVDEFGLDMIQLHGDETATFCSRISNQIKVIKAFRIADTDTNIDWLVNEYDEVCDYYLFDKGSAGLYGGTGEKFRWNLLENAGINKPFFLSGGIERSDALALKKFRHPFFYGVDVNSRFEISPGIKNMDIVSEFIGELQNA